MEWWIRMVSPMRRVCIRLAAGIRIRKSGLGQLTKEVHTCEYEDVHVMWEMLRKNDVEIRHVAKMRRKQQGVWSLLNSLCCAF